MPRVRVVVAALLVVVAAGCSDDDPSADPTGPTVTVAAPGPTIGAPRESTVAPTTAAPPAGLADLAAGLLSTADVGVPAGWAIRDVDPAIMDAEMAALADPLQGLATCPDGAIQPPADWVQRTFSGAEPLDTGMLRVDLVLAVEDVAAFNARQDALGVCAAVGESFLETSTGTVAPLDGTPLAPVGPETAATTLTLSAGPTADVPYPSTYAVVTANLDGRTVTAVVGGVDLGVPFADTTRELVGRVLARL